MNVGPQLVVKVMTPENTLYEGRVFAVSGLNEQGPFAILPGHANFISLVQGDVLIHETKHEAQKISLQQAILFCSNNKVDIYVAAMATS